VLARRSFQRGLRFTSSTSALRAYEAAKAAVAAAAATAIMLIINICPSRSTVHHQVRQFARELNGSGGASYSDSGCNTSLSPDSPTISQPAQ